MFHLTLLHDFRIYLNSSSTSGQRSWTPRTTFQVSATGTRANWGPKSPAQVGLILIIFHDFAELQHGLFCFGKLILVLEKLGATLNIRRFTAPACAEAICEKEAGPSGAMHSFGARNLSRNTNQREARIFGNTNGILQFSA